MLTLRLRPRQQVPEKGETRFRSTFDVLDGEGNPVPAFFMMADAIQSDIQNPAGSGKTALDEIRRIEDGETDKIESDGNAWVTYVTRDKVWFEGLYSQGEGGAVSFAQYKLAVQTYVRFLSDPERKPLEVQFPAD